MRTFLLSLTLLSVLGIAATHESPFACNRSALTAEQRKRHFDELGPKLRTLVVQAQELANGYAFEFPGDRATFELIAEWSAGERLCCPFFDIDLHMDQEGGATWIRLTGRPGTKDFIRTDFKAWFKQ